MITLNFEIQEKINRSSEPEHRFEFELEDLKDVIASWHSHPSETANLSIDDYRFFQSWPNQIHFIISIDEVRCYMTYKSVVYFIEEEKDYPTWPSGGEILG